jgi:hypothetical protein
MAENFFTFSPLGVTISRVGEYGPVLFLHLFIQINVV